MDYRAFLWDKILPRVQKATRYMGNEVNAVIKEHSGKKATIALAFPDLYEVGMSHLGLKVLYHLVNSNEEWLAERVFAPADDMQKVMEEEGFPLCSLESTSPLDKFDMIGFTLQYELSYPTILLMLQLANIPVEAELRREDDPLIIGGGPGVFNPEPVAPFFDVFLLGDGEEALPEIMCILEKNRSLSRKAKLEKFSRVKGVYIPSFYAATYSPEGEFLGTYSVSEHASLPVSKAMIKDLNNTFYPESFIVPYGDIVHDRLVLEVFRGCTRGCRFCQAGIIYRPLRERSPEKLKELSRGMVAKTGYDEIALSSLSTSDYSCIAVLVDELGKDPLLERVSLSLPSLRADSFSVELAQKVARVRKSGLTFAPEAGTQRLRNVINKNITEEDFLSAVESAFAAGWSSVKLYFMLGLPTESDDDVLGIADLASKVISVFRKVRGKGRPRITVSTSVFVPKPHTPFQWAGQISVGEMRRRQEILRGKLRESKINYQWHGAETSILEGALSRGGRDLAGVILHAVEAGCKLDGWQEHFSFSKWESAFAKGGLEIAEVACRHLDRDDPLPWDHLDSGVTKEYLWREFQLALQGKLSPDCRDKCLGCGINLLQQECVDKGQVR